MEEYIPSGSSSSNELDDSDIRDEISSNSSRILVRQRVPRNQAATGLGMVEAPEEIPGEIPNPLEMFSEDDGDSQRLIRRMFGDSQRAAGTRPRLRRRSTYFDESPISSSDSSQSNDLDDLIGHNPLGRGSRPNL
jgi:hypothetical protein